MSKNIKTSSVSQSGLTFYKFDIVDQNNPHTVFESKSFTSKEEAQKYFNNLKKSPEAGVTVNGQPIGSSDPFNPNDPSAFVDQGDTSAEQFTAPSGIAPLTGYDKDGNPVFGQTPQVTTSVTQLGGLNSEKFKEKSKNPIPTSKLKKLARDFCGFDDEKKEAIKALTKEETENEVGGTLGAGIKDQPKARRLNFANEKILQGIDNNSFIVLGNDRTGDFKNPGWGEAGHTQCDAIDLVAGLGGWCPKDNEQVEIEDVDGSKVKITGKVDTNPNFYIDAARIYISQKTNCDRNFGIGSFGKSENKKNTSEEELFGKYGAKSAVIAKADNIRLIGRESIKIVTGTDEFNSAGGRVSGKHGIELIAMNKEGELQPLVKGRNLSLALSVICKNIEAVAEMFQAYVDYQMKFNKALSKHTHITQFHAKQTLPSSQAMIGGTQCDVDTMVNTHLSVIKQVTNIQGVISNFLSPSGDAYILSRLNKTN